MKDFFISYNKADRSWAEWIAWQLEEEGYTTVIQAWDFRAGSNFVLEMDRATREAKRTIAVLSDDYLNASFTEPEWEAAFAKVSKGLERKLVPVRVREYKVESLLRHIVYIDLMGLDEAAAERALLEGVREGRRKPDSAPSFPGASARTISTKPRFPGTLPPVWNVTHQRNPNFTGRENMLEGLRKALMSGQRAALTQAIHGLGGVGKTQLAVEYAYRNMGYYDVVWWVRSEEPATLSADYAGLATELGLPEREAKEQEVMVQAARRWLERNPRWLLVFDNARKSEEVQPYLPQGGSGHVIITSRNPNWRGVGSTLHVEEMDMPKAVEFLLKRTGQRDEEAANALAEELGRLPLALEQAGAYMDVTGTSLRDYLRLFRLRRQDLWAEEGRLLGDKETVTTTWSLSIENVEKEVLEAVDLLRLCAYLAPDDIPKALLSIGKEHIPEPLSGTVVDTLKMNRAIESLRWYSLVEVDVDKQELSVHRLVQAVVRDGLTEDERKVWAGAAVSLLNWVFPDNSDDVRTWSECARLLPHALVATDHAEGLKASPEQTARLLNKVGMYLHGRAQFAESTIVLERALAISEAAYGPDHPTVATYLSNLGNMMRDMGDLQGARQHFERALAIDEAAYGPNHPTVATYLSNLGNMMRDMGDLQGARQHFERALAISEAAYGPNHPTVATDINNLGSVMRDMGDLQGARQHFERALAISEAAYGPDHPTIATYFNNLGSVMRDMGDLQGARQYFERALAIDEAAYGFNHPAAATDINNLGLVFQELGDFTTARQYFERALAIDEAAYGSDHPRIGIRLNNLAGVLKSLGDVKGAHEYYESALRTLDRRLGNTHPYTLQVAENLRTVEKLNSNIGGSE